MESDSKVFFRGPGRPDGRNADNYPDPTREDFDSISRREWAWEFLRRNPDYRAAYLRWKEAGGKRPAGWGRDGDGARRLAIYDADDHKTREEVAAEYPAEWAANRAYGEASERWSLKRPVDPDYPYRATLPDFIEKTASGGVVEIPSVTLVPNWSWLPGMKWPGYSDDPESKYPEQVALAFNLRFPIETQIKQAGELLQRLQGARKRAGYEVLERSRETNTQMDRLPLYLRLLDLKAAGATDAEIQRLLFGHLDKESRPKCMKKALKTAERLVHGGYRDLLLMPPYRIPEDEAAKQARRLPEIVKRQRKEAKRQHR